MDLKAIRESERKSHIDMYTSNELYSDGSWLHKPVKTVIELLPYFSDHESLNILDLGCGVGRNSIAVASHFCMKHCMVDCVDILPLAIEKLHGYAVKYHFENKIHGIVKPIEEFTIIPGKYDLILAISALEHIDSERSFFQKLREICAGTKKSGIACLIVNTNIKEYDKQTGAETAVQFEVNLSTERLLEEFDQIFTGWNVLRSHVRTQEYAIPRDTGLHLLKTDVVTFAARK